jgi:hypothetical protein
VILQWSVFVLFSSGFHHGKSRLAVWQTQIRMKRRKLRIQIPIRASRRLLRLLRFSFRNRARSWTESQKKANIWARKGEFVLRTCHRASREIGLSGGLGTQKADKKAVLRILDVHLGS